MRLEKVSCDGCGADLTTRTNSVDYRLVLASESKPGHGAGAYTDMMIYPAVKRAHHFCDLACLDHWRDRQRYLNQLWCEWWDKWKAEHGTKYGDGWMSYPDAPKDVRDSRKAEFEKEALVKFPMEFSG